MWVWLLGWWTFIPPNLPLANVTFFAAGPWFCWWGSVPLQHPGANILITAIVLVRWLASLCWTFLQWNGWTVPWTVGRMPRDHPQLGSMDIFCSLLVFHRADGVHPAGIIQALHHPISGVVPDILDLVSTRGMSFPIDDGARWEHWSDLVHLLLLGPLGCHGFQLSLNTSVGKLEEFLLVLHPFTNRSFSWVLFRCPQ